MVLFIFVVGVHFFSGVSMERGKGEADSTNEVKKNFNGDVFLKEAILILCFPLLCGLIDLIFGLFFRVHQTLMMI